MNDYIRAYSEIAPLLDAYDRHLPRITDLYNDAHERDWRLLRVRAALKNVNRLRPRLAADFR